MPSTARVMTPEPDRLPSGWRELAPRPADAAERTLVVRNDDRIVGFASAPPP